MKILLLEFNKQFLVKSVQPYVTYHRLLGKDAKNQELSVSALLSCCGFFCLSQANLGIPWKTICFHVWLPLCIHIYIFKKSKVWIVPLRMLWRAVSSQCTRAMSFKGLGQDDWSKRKIMSRLENSEESKYIVGKFLFW